LKQTLVSIIAQTFSDFEVIVGNDYVKEPLSADRLGIKDPRIRFVNHPQNLGEARNMNTLLDLARSRYFTWLCDDDLYAPNFLEEVYSTLLKFHFPTSVFTSFNIIHGTSYSNPVKIHSGQGQMFSGRKFIRMYWSSKLKAMGCTGVYNKEYLKQIGGVKCLADTSRPLFSEHLLLIKTGLLEKVVHIDKPLVLYRVHENSWGSTNKDLTLIKQAGQNLVRESVNVFSSPGLRADFRQNITSVLEFAMKNLFWKLRAIHGFVNKVETAPHLFSLKKQFRPLKGSVLYWTAFYSWIRIGMRLVWWPIAKLKIKSVVPSGLIKFVVTIRSLLKRN